MRGILVAGAAANAGEAEVARALAEEARRSGEAAVVLAPGPEDGAVPPAIAARHAGMELEPAHVVGEARAAGEKAFLLVTTAGGLLAPLAERYANRDLALELRLPVVVAVPAGPGLQNAALLALEAARGAGLAVPALLLTGWPERPSRALLDERAMLERHAGVPVDHLRDGPEWPVVDWAAGAVDSEEPAPVRVALDPYEAWEEHPVGDPRQASRGAIMETMLAIVAAEGPMRASRAYSLYNRAAGGRKLTSVARAPLSSAVYWLAQERRVVLTRKDDIPWQDDDLVRLPDTAPVRVRELGPRTLEEVPLDEIAELAGRLRAARGAGDPTELKRAILSTYGLMRLTSRADEYLGLALDLAEAD